MSQAQILTTVLIWFLFGAQHSFFAQRYFKNIVGRALGENYLNYGYRFSYFVSQAIAYSIFWSFVTQMDSGSIVWVLPSALEPWHFVLRVTGHLLIVCSLLAADVNSFTGLKPLLIFCKSRLKGESVPSLEGIGVNKLSRSFPFSMVRHPMYLGIFLSLLASRTAYSEKLILNLICLVAYIEIGSFFEERQLVRVFGRDYVEYQEGTPKYLPLISMNILSHLRRLVIRLCLPIFWRSSKEKTAMAMSQFATTEFDGAWQGLFALEKISDPEIRAQIFQHSLEEFNHGSLFRKMSNKYCSNLMPLVTEERTPLFSGATEQEGLRRFYSCEYVGEITVRDEFQTYEAACPHQEIKNLFQRLAKDERHHANYTRRVYAQVVPSVWKREYYSAEVRLKRLYEAWCRLGIGLGNVTSTVILGFIYYLFGAFTKLPLFGRKKA